MKIVIIEPLGITPEKLAEATAEVKARGHEIVVYDTKEVNLWFSSIFPVDKDGEGTIYERAIKRIKDYVGEDVKVEIDSEIVAKYKLIKQIEKMKYYIKCSKSLVQVQIL